MAQVFSTSPFVLGKRSGLSFHSSNNNNHCGGGAAGDSPLQHKKRRLVHEEEDGGSPDGSRSPDTGSSHYKRFRAVGSYTPGSSAGMMNPFGFQPQQQQQQQQQQQHQQLDPQDQPQYSARTLEAELSKVRAECRAHIAEKEAGMVAAAGAVAADLERTQAENRILKRAVTIQNTRCKEVEGQLSSLQAAAMQAAEYVKRLEQTNYALGMRVQQMDAGQQHSSQGSGGGGFFGGHRPPDVF
jgi:hypothetical protein